MTEQLVPTQEMALALALLAWVGVSATLLLAVKVNGQAPASLRYAMVALWLYATLRLYSASSFVWASTLKDVLPLLRLGVLAISTLLVMLVLTLFAYYWRRWRAGR